MAQKRPWIRDLIITALLAMAIVDYIGDEFWRGYNAGLSEGYQQGLTQRPQTWKTMASPTEID